MNAHPVFRGLTIVSRPLAVLALVLATTAAQADIIDLTKAGNSGTVNGAIYQQTDPQPTGTGNLQPFVRIQMTGTERGYNTDARPVEFDTKDQNQWTHSLNVNDLASVDISGTSYFQFLLDINEIGNNEGKLLSLNDVKVYLGNAPDLTGFNDGFGANSVKVYDLDTGEDSTVELDYKLNHGSGSGDMFLYIPTANFVGPNEWVYLYSAFGNPNASDAGFEEWAAKMGDHVPPPPPPPQEIPAPPALLLGVFGIGCCMARSLRRRATTA
jgi:hypothetical protein